MYDYFSPISYVQFVVSQIQGLQLPIIEKSNDIHNVIASIGEIDVLIVGTGPAGVMITNELCTKGHRILMIEAGNRLPDTDSEDYFEFEDGHTKGVNFGLSWQLGGTSNLWAGRCAPLEPFDLSKNKGWPFNEGELDPYYQRASKVLELGDWNEVSAVPSFSRKDEKWNDLLKNFGWSEKKFQWNRPCFNAGRFLDSLCADHDNLFVLLNTRVLKFNQSRDDGTVTSLKTVSSAGDRLDIVARYYVLASGGIETPRILLNSDDVEKQGLGNSSDTLGRYFSTHPKGNVGTLHLAEPVRLNTPMFSDTKVNGLNLRFGLGRRFDENSDGDALNHYVQFSARFEKLGTKLLEHVQHSIALKKASVQSEGIGGKLVHWISSRLQLSAIICGRIFFNLVGKFGIIQRSASIFTVRGFFDQYPDKAHRIVLRDTRDQFGMRKAKVVWQFGSKDIASVKVFLQTLQRDVENSGVGKLLITPPDENWNLTGIHSHFLGAARMGSDHKTSVTDENGRLHECDNIYLSGSCLFPSYGYANPVLTICAMAIRTADKMNDVLANES